MHNALTERELTLIRLATYASVTVAVGLISIKFFAWVMTNAVSLQATLVDSLLDGMASFINLVAIRHALRPADKEHRFGHGKIEAIAALGQSAFISGSAGWLFYEALHRLIQPEPLIEIKIGLVTMIVSIIVTIFLVAFQQYVVKKTSSAAIRADSIHYKSDIMVNLSVLLALGLSNFFQHTFFDPIIGAAIAFYILYTAWDIIKHSFDILIDREFPDEAREEITRIAASHPKVKGIHDLRTRSSGSKSFIQLHLEMDPEMTLQEAHKIAEKVSHNIRIKFPRAEIIIHEDPYYDAHDDELEKGDI
ncbi:cation diffusion facilitator family transporter [Candidatus Nucleicultrix amoebiphila]|jgi:ferrous-iron efflux pump FieF|uniref:Cation-efflux pump FieF n=1 Tax=Candidatus Nucleicultrix amoebiphila FS5 TaxID=1414854 RepID=A0A1W6N5A7_9PROT|nr:cation diffusion facilitator family transporter [Candidatus Nucleicultrix amoebiphila]ARN84956.1 ferrous iron transporter [Candidatus Nucleicultrix amoebiphila FS5]